MSGESAFTWCCVAFGTALAMSLVFDRDRLLRWALVRGSFWAAYVLFCLCAF